ncbi:unnamed protein product [Cuscuta epithymum]|uniref:Uncharacterized protein n=1 Tax=Cuscuta epithymum TaxID=186058 RepID=A0AAV0DY24_9ASTE|nr:unnamed protein product [Cuscuta epithymum]
MGDVNDDDFWAFWDATVGGGDDGAHQTEGTPVVAGEGGGQTSAAAGLEGQTSGAHQTEEDDRNKAQIGEDDQPMLEASMDVVYELGRTSSYSYFVSVDVVDWSCMFV